jgi:hypothetical protein
VKGVTLNPLFPSLQNPTLPKWLPVLAVGHSCDNKLALSRHRYLPSQLYTFQQQANTFQTDALFHTFSQYASMSNIPAKPDEDEQRTEAQLEDILERVSHL